MPDHPTRSKPGRSTPPPRTAANKQTADALALADIMSGDRSSRSPRGPAVDPAAVAEPAAASSETRTQRALADVRTASPSPDARAASPSPEARTGSAGSADSIILSRREVDSALADFAKLTTAIHASFSPTGVVVTDVTRGTLFERAGLRPGDTITAVDGTHLRSLDDAANLYARASSASSLTVQLLRNAQPVTLRVVIQ